MTNEELPESLRDPLKVIERGRVLLQLTEQRNAAWDEIEQQKGDLARQTKIIGQMMATISALRSALTESKREHYVCDGDCWFSCPKSGQCCDDDRGDSCDCGADEWNAKVDAILGIQVQPVRPDI